MAEHRARIAVVDDHPLFRHGLVLALADDPTLHVVGAFGRAAEALALAESHPIDLVVVDILMPDMTGISFAAELARRQPACKVFGLSVIDEPGIIADLLRATASGFACKADSSEEIARGIRAVLAGERYLSPRVSHEAVNALLAAPSGEPLTWLTAREREIFELVIRGHSNDQIADSLGISRRTVETHRHRLTNKLSARTVIELQRLSARYGGL